MDAWLWVWLAVTCVSALLEFFTCQMVAIWFVLGGIAAMILAACGVMLEIQIVVFILVSLVLLLALRRVSLRLLLRGKGEKTNIDALVGRETKLLSDIALDKMGSVRISDVEWSAIAQSDTAEISAGTLVRVLDVRGNKLVVEPVIESEGKVEDATAETKSEEVKVKKEIKIEDGAEGAVAEESGKALKSTNEETVKKNAKPAKAKSGQATKPRAASKASTQKSKPKK